MAVFDVTVSRTGCITVEADTPDEALFVAENCDENEVSWTDEWGADNAERIASSLEEMGEDASLIKRASPFTKAMMIAFKHFLFCCPTTDGRLCITTPDAVAAMAGEFNKIVEEIHMAGYSTELVPARNLIGAIPYAENRACDTIFVLVSMPNSFTVRVE